MATPQQGQPYCCHQCLRIIYVTCTAASAYSLCEQSCPTLAHRVSLRDQGPHATIYARGSPAGLRMRTLRRHTPQYLAILVFYHFRRVGHLDAPRAKPHRPAEEAARAAAARRRPGEAMTATMQTHEADDEEQAVAETPLLPQKPRRRPRLAAAAATLVLVGAAADADGAPAMQRLWTPFDGNLMPPDSWAGFSCELV